MTKLSIAAGAAAADYRDLPSQLQHWFHPGHSLKLVPNNDGVKFKCDGCKLPGTGARYECEQSATGRCTLDLHIRCALAPDVREIGGHWFVFLVEPLPAGEGRTFCDACGGAATGFVYHCPDLEHDVHPCCAGLPESFHLAGLSFELRIKDDDVPRPRCCALCADKTKCRCKCGSRRCGVNRACWSYRSVDDDVFLHVACATDLACDRFAEVNVSLGKPMAAQASETGTGSAVVFDPSRGDQEMVQVKEAALRGLLLKGQGRGNRGRDGAFERSLRVLGFIVRVVIGVIFGDPTAMIVAVGQALSAGG